MIIDLLHDWQELAAGILAFIAGAFIFIQGKLERRAVEGARAEDAEKEIRKTRDILGRLSVACKALSDALDGAREGISDVVAAIDRGEQYDLPPRLPLPKIFEVIFAQLTTQAIPVEIYVQLSGLLDRGAALNKDFSRFLVVYSDTVTQHRRAQARFPLKVGRSASEEPAVQALNISIDALQEVSQELQSTIEKTLL